MILTITNQKGGVGKTTLALHLAGEFASRGLETKLIDMDPQHSAMHWSVQRDAYELPALFDLEGYPQPNLHKHIARKAATSDVVIIDVPPQVEALARSAIISADVVLIPVKPSALDIWAAGATIALLEEASIYKPSLRGYFVLNGQDSRTSIGRDARRALAEHEGVDRLDSIVHERVAFKYSVAQGQTIQEYEPGGAAAREVRLLARQLMALHAGQAEQAA